MDLSSKYFTLLRAPGPEALKHAWRFGMDIHRVGKLRELISFILWEIRHRFHIYRYHDRYLKFTAHPSVSISRQEQEPADDLITSEFLRENELCFRRIAIDWKFCFQTRSGLCWGTRFADPNALCCSQDQSQSAFSVYEFAHPITALFVSRQNVLFICSNGIVYASTDQGVSFNPVLRFSSSISYFLFNNGMTELPDGTLIIGEYGSIWQGDKWQNLAYLYSSTDGGITWEKSDFLIRQGVNKHIHLVKYSPLLKAVLLTDGDNKKQLWLKKNATDVKADKEWHLVTKFHHQTGGYLSMAETEEGVLFGSDYLGGTNFVVSTTDGQRFRKLVLPDPYRRSPIMNMVCRQSASSSEIWATSYSCLSDSARSLMMCTRDAGKTWTRVLDFVGAKHEVRLVNASHDRTEDLYISITEFQENQDQPTHRVYKLDRVRQARDVASS